MKYPIAIVLAALVLGGFYSYTAHESQVSTERQAQMKIEQENKAAELDREQKGKEVQAQKAEQQAQAATVAKIKQSCSTFLERHGNYLVSNETLETNYGACLHENGL